LAKELEAALQTAATATRSHTLTPIKRGGPFERYYPTAGEFLFIIMFTDQLTGALTMELLVLKELDPIGKLILYINIIN